MKKKIMIGAALFMSSSAAFAASTSGVAGSWRQRVARRSHAVASTCPAAAKAASARKKGVRPGRTPFLPPSPAASNPPDPSNHWNLGKFLLIAVKRGRNSLSRPERKHLRAGGRHEAGHWSWVRACLLARPSGDVGCGREEVRAGAASSQAQFRRNRNLRGQRLRLHPVQISRSQTAASSRRSCSRPRPTCRRAAKSRTRRGPGSISMAPTAKSSCGSPPSPRPRISRICGSRRPRGPNRRPRSISK